MDHLPPKDLSEGDSCSVRDDSVALAKPLAICTIEELADCFAQEIAPVALRVS